MEQNPGAWRLDDATVARMLSREDLAGHWLLGSRMVVNPGEAALWMLDGKAMKVVSEGGAVVSGVLDRLKSLFFAGGNLTVVMMDVNDITLNFRMGVDKESVFAQDPSFYGKLLSAYGQNAGQDQEAPADGGAPGSREEQIARLVGEYAQALDDELQKRNAILTKDRESVAFDVRLTLHILPEKGVNLFKVFGAKTVLQRSDIESMARLRLETALFAPHIAQYTGSQLRQDLKILARMNKAAAEDMMTWLPAHGMGLKRLAVNPALTGQERKAIIEKEKNALKSAAEHRHGHDLEEMNREFERLVMREKLAAQLVQAQAGKDEEKQKILHATFLANQDKKLSAAQVADKIERIRLNTRLEAQKKLKEMELLGGKRKLELDKERMSAQASLEMDKMRVLAEEYRKNKDLKARHKLREMELRHHEARNEREHVERILELGAREGAVTGGVLQEAIRQQSVRKALDQGDSVGRAMAESEGKRLPGPDQKALPDLPSISITGQGPMLVETGARSPSEATDRQALPPAQNQRSLPSPGDQQTIVTICPACGEPVTEGSAYCGLCGKKLDGQE